MTHEPIWIGTSQKNSADNTLPPELFRHIFTLEKLPMSAVLRVTAMGIYEASVNGKKAGDAFFTPSYTHYESYVQEETWDIAHRLLLGENRLDILVANGWWLGTLGDRNNRYGDHRGLRATLLLTYESGAEETIVTDDTWQWTDDTPLRYTDFYNGEIYDGTRSDESGWHWHTAVPLTKDTPAVQLHDGAFVRIQEELKPVAVHENIYDFGQNHAGVVRLRVKASKGTVITVRHAELLDNDDKPITQPLRSAKATLTWVCGQDGEQEYMPRFTFMGFRYAEVTADAPIEVLLITSPVLTSDCPVIGRFSCSDERLNRLYQNTQWGQTSNFIDIPTDCPQRDERMGWTGDIAVFAETAAMNRNIHDFMRKWLRDLRLYQREDGAIPVVIPENATFQPEGRVFPIAIWGDAAVLVPWAVWQAYGDKALLAEQYPSMKMWVEAELNAAAAHGEGLRRWVWDENDFQFGDWCAPGEPYESWIVKGNDLATAFMFGSISRVAEAAEILKKKEDAAGYRETLRQIQNAYAALYIHENGYLKGDYASHYACALYFGLIPSKNRPACAARLAELVRANGYRIPTGFAGTPYILFALADNGYREDAYRLLLNEECPGWLYPIRLGATTMWERWDALGEDGVIDPETLGMVSFNHYAYGAVCAFFYRRILGIEPLEAGYRRFRVQPVIGGGLTHAEGGIGDIHVSWAIEGDKLTLTVDVPAGHEAEIILPDGKAELAPTGRWQRYIPWLSCPGKNVKALR